MVRHFRELRARVTLMEKRTPVILLLMLALMLSGNGCVSRTATRSQTIDELARRRSLNGYVVEKKIIWIWEKEFWQH